MGININQIQKHMLMHNGITKHNQSRVRIHKPAKRAFGNAEFPGEIILIHRLNGLKVPVMIKVPKINKAIKSSPEISSDLTPSLIWSGMRKGCQFLQTSVLLCRLLDNRLETQCRLSLIRCADFDVCSIGTVDRIHASKVFAVGTNECSEFLFASALFRCHGRSVHFSSAAVKGTHPCNAGDGTENNCTISDKV